MELGRPEEALPLHRELLPYLVARATGADAKAEELSLAASILLTIEDESLRDPERALGFAERSCALLEESHPGPLWSYLPVLVEAQYETGDTEAAIENLRRSLSLMPEGADSNVAERLADFEAARKGE